jgi:sarcosine oxidase subunit delta
MLIACPYCGARDAQEFSYRGDATLVRPDPAAPDAAEKFHDYVYLRDNPAGAHREFWYHGAGCRRWLEVERDTLTHAITATRFAAQGGRA